MATRVSIPDVRAAALAYFDGLAKKNVSAVPWAENATLCTSLNPNGGEDTLIRGRASIQEFFVPLLPNLGEIEVLRTFIDGDWVLVRARVALGNGKALRVLDAFRIQNGRIVEQENFYDPRPALE